MWVRNCEQLLKSHKEIFQYVDFTLNFLTKLPERLSKTFDFFTTTINRKRCPVRLFIQSTLIPLQKGTFACLSRIHCLTHTEYFSLSHWPPPPHNIPHRGGTPCKGPAPRITLHYENVCTQKSLFFIYATSAFSHCILWHVLVRSLPNVRKDRK